MSRLNEESLNILYTILYQVREDYPDINFMWTYRFGLDNYVLIYKPKDSKFEIDRYEFENEINEKYQFIEKATLFMNINHLWLSISEDDSDEIEANVDIVEQEIIVNTYKLKGDK